MSIVYRSVKGSKLTSAEVDGNFQYLENLVGGQGNSIVTENGFTLVDQDLTIAADWVWKILNITYTNTAAVVINIPFASSGNQRIDLIVANQSNTFERIAGVESASNPSAPAVPLNKIFVTFVTVTDGVIDEPETPIVGTQFKQKNEAQKITQVLGGTDAVIELRTFGQQHYVAIGPVTSIAGFSKALITASPTAEVPYSGKDFYFENKTDHNVTLKNAFSPVDIPFNLGADLLVPTNGIVWLKYNSATEKMDLFFKSWSEVDLSTKVDKVSTTGVERAYIINADGSQGTKPSSEFGISLPDLQRYSIYAWRPTPTGWYGFSTPAFVGTADNQSPLFSGNDFIKSVRHRRLSAATAGSSSEYYEQSFRQTSIGDGFYFSIKFGNEDASAVSDARVFAGLLGDLAVFGNVNPSAKANIIGVGADSGDANLSFIHNDGAGTATKVSLGASFPANTIANDLYCLQIYNIPGSASIWYRVINVSTKVETAWVEITTNLPAVNQILLPKCWRNNGTTALAVRLSLVDLTLYKRI